MASPQKEHGFTPIANELLRALVKRALPGRQLRIWLAIAIDSYGQSRKETSLSINEISRMTGIDRTSVVRGLNGLVVARMLLPPGGRKEATNHKIVRKINKDYDTWVDARKPLGRAEATRPSGAEATSTNKVVVKKEKNTYSAEASSAPVDPPSAKPEPTTYRIPEKAKDPVGFLVMQYKLKQIGMDNFDDRLWDRRHWSRSARAAKELIEITGGVDDAHRCLVEKAKELEESGREWKFETVVSLAHRWKARKENGRRNSSRFSSALASQSTRQVRTPLSLGSSAVRDFVASAGKMSDGVRDMQSRSTDPRPLNGAGDRHDEETLG